MGTWALRHLAAASVAFDTRPLARDDWPLFEGPGPEPPPFEYEAPRNADEAVALLAQHGDRAEVLAGGQRLPLLNFRHAQPEVLVDVNRVAELAYVRGEAVKDYSRMSTGATSVAVALATIDA